MWSSIEQIIQPDSLSEAAVLLQDKGSVIFAGGSYLVSQKDSAVHTLIDINHLINSKFDLKGTDLHIDAGCTLQEMLQCQNEPLKGAVQACCPSKNIRNQRTIGGEIATARPDSDLLIFLYTARTQLILSHLELPINLVDWDGKGIIVEVIIPSHALKMERVALLDSAPAFVIVGRNIVDDLTTVCVGGKVKALSNLHTSDLSGESQLDVFLDEVEAKFTDDHLGSAAYKRKMVGNLLKEMDGAK